MSQRLADARIALMQVVCKNIDKWLRETYKCTEVPIASYVEGKECLDIEWETEFVIFKDEPKDRCRWDKVSKDVKKALEEPKKIITDKLLLLGIKPGETLEVRQFPYCLNRPSLRNERKFGWVGWMEIFG